MRLSLSFAAIARSIGVFDTYARKFCVAQATSPARSRDREARWLLVRAGRWRTPYLSSGRVLAARLTSGERVLFFLVVLAGRLD